MLLVTSKTPDREQTVGWGWWGWGDPAQGPAPQCIALPITRAGIPAGRFVLDGSPARAIRPGPWPGWQARMRPQEALSWVRGWALPHSPASPSAGTLHLTGATAPPGPPALEPSGNWVRSSRTGCVNSSWGPSLRPPQFPAAMPTVYNRVHPSRFPPPSPSLPLFLPCPSPSQRNLPWKHSLYGSQWKLCRTAPDCVTSGKQVNLSVLRLPLLYRRPPAPL